MSKRNYEQEFKTTIIELLNSGKSPKDLSKEYGASLASINRWKKELSTDQLSKSASDSVVTNSKIKALEKELKDVKLERDILKKAVSIFSKSDR